jgi:FAD/FMN-containing dehydrogenase
MPVERHTAFCALNSFEDVVQLLKSARTDLRGLSALEVMWGDYFELLQELEQECLFHPAPPMVVILETEANRQGADGEDFEDFLATMLEQDVLFDALIAKSDRETAAFWAVREGDKIYEAFSHLINLDVSVGIGQMGQFVEACKRDISARFPDVPALFYGHAGDGNLHIALNFPESDNDQLLHELETIICDNVQKMGGSISAEHGIGTLKKGCLRYSRSVSELQVMRQIKAALDPQGLLNPGKVI